MSSPVTSVSTIITDVADLIRCRDCDTDGFGRAFQAVLETCRGEKNKSTISASAQAERACENREGTARPWSGFTIDPTEEYAILDEGGPPFPFRTS